MLVKWSGLSCCADHVKHKDEYQEAEWAALPGCTSNCSAWRPPPPELGGHEAGGAGKEQAGRVSYFPVWFVSGGEYWRRSVDSPACHVRVPTLCFSSFWVYLNNSVFSFNVTCSCAATETGASPPAEPDLNAEQIHSERNIKTRRDL